MRLFYENKKIDMFSINLKYATGATNPNFDPIISASHDIYFFKG